MESKITFRSLMDEFHLKASAMKRLMSECGMTPDIDAEFTDEQYDMLFDKNEELRHAEAAAQKAAQAAEQAELEAQNAAADEETLANPEPEPEPDEEPESESHEEEGEEEIAPAVDEDAPESEDETDSEDLYTALTGSDTTGTQDTPEIDTPAFDGIPSRPLADVSRLPSDEAPDYGTVQELSEGSTVYVRRGNTEVPYGLIELLYSEKNGSENIYAVRNRSSSPSANENLAAKIFAPKFRTKRLEAKIRAMIRARLYHEHICYPVNILTDKDGAFAGYTMRRPKGEKLSAIIAGLKKHEAGHFFSGWDRRSFANVIIAVLECMKSLHDNNVLMCDVCPENITVDSPREVYFINTDRYQFLQDCTLENLADSDFLGASGWKVSGYPCTFARQKYTSPELDEALAHFSPSIVMRTKDDELFALSVLLFEIVMMGKWPYDIRGKVKPSVEEAKNRKAFFYPDFFLTNRMISENRTAKCRNIPKYGLANLPEGYVQMWDHLRPNVKKAFREAFAKNGGHSSEGTRYTVDEWLAVFTEYSRDLSWWGGSNYDPANLELFPKLFVKLRTRKGKDGTRTEIQYTECRFCHDLVESSECRGKYHDECSLCWDEGETQTCSHCGTEFLITRKEAENTRHIGNTLRTLCDDCQQSPPRSRDPYMCSKGHTFRLSRREDDAVYWRLWRNVPNDERDYSILCPECLEAVTCEKCGRTLNITKRRHYEMERDGVPFSHECPHCKPVSVKCEECGHSFEVENHVRQEIKSRHGKFSEICPENPEVEAKCERCGQVFEAGKHTVDRLKAEGKLYTLCPEGEIVEAVCSKCGTVHRIERYWSDAMSRRGEKFVCGNHNGFLGIGASGSVEPKVNHRQ